MGILNSFVSALAKGVSQQLWDVYQQSCNSDPKTLESYLEFETNYMKKACYLLAIARRNPSKANSIYREERSRYNNAFNNMKKYNKFQSVIDDFMRYCSSHNY